MDKSNLSYEDMTPGKVFEQTEVPTDRVPFENYYETSRSGSDGFDESGMSLKRK